MSFEYGSTMYGLRTKAPNINIVVVAHGTEGNGNTEFATANTQAGAGVHGGVVR